LYFKVLQKKIFHIHIGLILTRAEKKNAWYVFLLYKEQYNKKKGKLPQTKPYFGGYTNS
jgi:hypothetical protein